MVADIHLAKGHTHLRGALAVNQLGLSVELELGLVLCYRAQG